MNQIRSLCITCMGPAARPREFAIVIRDGVLVWCKLCRQHHHIRKEDCIEVWDGSKGTISRRETCNHITHKNKAGRDKLYATIDAKGVSCWCKHCREVHYITPKECLQMWG